MTREKKIESLVAEAAYRLNIVTYEDMPVLRRLFIDAMDWQAEISIEIPIAKRIIEVRSQLNKVEGVMKNLFKDIDGKVAELEQQANAICRHLKVQS